MTTQNIKVKISFIVILTLQVSMLSTVSASIFKCENQQGEVYYHDKPCPVIDNETEMNHEKDVKNGYAPPKLNGSLVKPKDMKKTSDTHVAEKKNDRKKLKSKSVKLGTVSSTHSTTSGIRKGDENVNLTDVDIDASDSEPVMSMLEEEKVNKIIKQRTPKITLEQKIKAIKISPYSTNTDLMK